MRSIELPFIEKKKNIKKTSNAHIKASPRGLVGLLDVKARVRNTGQSYIHT